MADKSLLREGRWRSCALWRPWGWRHTDDLSPDLVSGRASVPTGMGHLLNGRSVLLRQRMRLPSCSVLSLLGLPVLRRQRPVPARLRARRQMGSEAAAGSAGASPDLQAIPGDSGRMKKSLFSLGEVCLAAAPAPLHEGAQALLNAGLYSLRQDGPSSSLACTIVKGRHLILFTVRSPGTHSADT